MKICFERHLILLVHIVIIHLFHVTCKSQSSLLDLEQEQQHQQILLATTNATFLSQAQEFQQQHRRLGTTLPYSYSPVLTLSSGFVLATIDLPSKYQLVFDLNPTVATGTCGGASSFYSVVQLTTGWQAGTGSNLPGVSMCDCGNTRCSQYAIQVSYIGTGATSNTWTDEVYLHSGTTVLSTSTDVYTTITIDVDTVSRYFRFMLSGAGVTSTFYSAGATMSANLGIGQAWFNAKVYAANSFNTRGPFGRIKNLAVLRSTSSAGSVGVVSAWIGSPSVRDAAASAATGTVGTACSLDGISTIAFSPDKTIMYGTSWWSHYVFSVSMATGQCNVIAGQWGVDGFTNGVGTAAVLSNPTGIAISAAVENTFDIYVANYNYWGWRCRISKIAAALSDSTYTYTVTTLSGTGTCSSINSPAASVTFNNPGALVLNVAQTSLYVVEEGNCNIRKLSLSALVATTVYGTSTCTGKPAIRNIAVTADETVIYIADYAYHSIRKYDVGTATLTILAGPGLTTGEGYQEGNALWAQMYYPYALYLSSDEKKLYFSEAYTSFAVQYGNRVRRVNLDYSPISTQLVAGAVDAGSAAGTQSSGGQYDLSGSLARFNVPSSLIYKDGVLYVAENFGDSIRKMDISGIPSTASLNNYAIYYPFNGTVTDSTGTTTAMLGGTAYSSVAFPDASSTGPGDVGPGGRAIFFANTYLTAAGPSQYVFIPNPLGWGEFTISFMMKPLSVTQRMSIFGICADAAPASSTAASNFLTVDVQTASSLLMRIGGTGGAANGGSSVSSGLQYVANRDYLLDDGLSNSVWNHIAIQYQAISATESKVTSYVNGAPKYSIDGVVDLSAYASGAVKMILGANCENSKSFSGYVDDFKVYNYPLSDAEVSKLYKNTFGRSQRMGMVSYFVGHFYDRNLAIADSSVGFKCVIDEPSGIVTTPDGSTLYVNSKGRHVLMKIDVKTQVCQIVVGLDNVGGSSDGVGSAARLNNPKGLAITPDGTKLFISTDVLSGCYIRQVSISGSTYTVTTLAGTTTGTCSTVNGVGASNIKLNNPGQLALAITNSVATDLYIVDEGNCNIRRIELSTVTATTAVGNGACTGTLKGPRGLAFNSDSTKLYISDYGANKILVWTVGASSTAVTVVAGTGATGSYEGLATSSKLYYVYGLAMSSDYNFLYFSEGKPGLATAEGSGNRIRRLSLTGSGDSTSLVAGAVYGNAAVLENGNGDGQFARFNAPTAIVFLNNTLYVCDQIGDSVRKVDVSLLPSSLDVTIPSIHYDFGSSTASLADKIGRTAINYNVDSTTGAAWATPTFMGATKGHALYLNGATGKRIAFANPLGWQTSISLFFKPDSISSDQGLMGLCSTSAPVTADAYLMQIGFRTGILTQIRIGSTTTPLSAGTTTDAGGITTGWNHLVIVTFGSSASSKVYVNNVLKSTITMDTSNNPKSDSGSRSSKWVLGSSCDLSQSGATAFKGYVDDIRVYSHPLAASDVQYLYNLYMNEPSPVPTAMPSALPSPVPSTLPSPVPSALPSPVPSALPSALPSPVPSALPSQLPSALPSALPSPVPSAQIDTSLIWNYQFEAADVSGTIVANKVSEGSSATLVGSPSMGSGSPSAYGDGNMVLDTASNYITLPSLTIAGTAYTVAWWMKYSTTTHYVGVFNFLASTNWQSGTLVSLSPDKVLFIGGDAGEGNVGPTGGYSIASYVDLWAHYAVVLGNVEHPMLYVNGVLVHTWTYGPQTNTRTYPYCTFGTSSWASTEKFYGSVDDIRLYTRQLTATEINAIINFTPPSALPSAPPSPLPSALPSSVPSPVPTGQPSSQSIRQPTETIGQPTSQQTGQPTGPTGQPTRQPTRQPTTQPSRQPSRQPSGQPTSRPSREDSLSIQELRKLAGDAGRSFFVQNVLYRSPGCHDEGKLTNTFFKKCLPVFATAQDGTVYITQYRRLDWLRGIKSRKLNLDTYSEIAETVYGNTDTKCLAPITRTTRDYPSGGVDGLFEPKIKEVIHCLPDAANPGLYYRLTKFGTQYLETSA